MSDSNVTVNRKKGAATGRTVAVSTLRAGDCCVLECVLYKVGAVDDDFGEVVLDCFESDDCRWVSFDAPVVPVRVDIAWEPLLEGE